MSHGIEYRCTVYCSDHTSQVYPVESFHTRAYGLNQSYQITCEILTPTVACCDDRICLAVIDEQSTRYFHGVITQVIALSSTRTALIFAAPLDRLLLQTHQRNYVMTTYEAMLKSITAAIALPNFILQFETTTTPARPFTVQYQETDFAFFQRLIAEAGWYYSFEQTTDTCTLLIQDEAHFATTTEISLVIPTVTSLNTAGVIAKTHDVTLFPGQKIAFNRSADPLYWITAITHRGFPHGEYENHLVLTEARPKFRQQQAAAGGMFQLATADSAVDNRSQYPVKFAYDVHDNRAASLPLETLQFYGGQHYGMHFPYSSDTTLLMTYTGANMEKPVIFSGLSTVASDTHTLQSPQAQQVHFTENSSAVLFDLSSRAETCSAQLTETNGMLLQTAAQPFGITSTDFTGQYTSQLHSVTANMSQTHVQKAANLLAQTGNMQASSSNNGMCYTETDLQVFATGSDNLLSAPTVTIESNAMEINAENAHYTCTDIAMTANQAMNLCNAEQYPVLLRHKQMTIEMTAAGDMRVYAKRLGLNVAI